MRVSDYIANRLAEFGVRHVFMVTGGGAMFLNYSLGKHKNIQPIFDHHEQAAAMAAEGYARITNKPSVLNVTTGPGGINALNGVDLDVFGWPSDAYDNVAGDAQTRAASSRRRRRLKGFRR